MNRKLTIFIITFFFFAVGISVVATNLSAAIPAWYLALSIMTFVAYAIDKSAARKGRWRTSESALHYLALAGGWPGALLGQQILRHKNRKRSFLFIFSITVLLNCAALTWLHMPEGRLKLDSLISNIHNLTAGYSVGIPSWSRSQN